MPSLREPLRPTPQLIAEVSSIAQRPVTRSDVHRAVAHFATGADYAHPHEARDYPTRRDTLQARDLLLPALVPPAAVPYDVAAYLSLQRWLPWAATPFGSGKLHPSATVPDAPWPWEGGPPFDDPVILLAGAAEKKEKPSGGRRRAVPVSPRGVDVASWQASLDLRAVTTHTSLLLVCEVTAALAVVLAAEHCTHIVCAIASASDAVAPHLGRFGRLQRFADSSWVAGVTSALKKTSSKNITDPTPAELSAVEPLSLPTRRIRDLSLALRPAQGRPLKAPVAVNFPRLLTDVAATLTSLTVFAPLYGEAIFADEYFAPLSRCRGLRHLDVLNARFGKQGSAAIGTLPRLEHVSLCATHLCNDSLALIAASPSITYLDISGNPLSDVSPLRRITTLATLCVYWGDGYAHAARDLFPSGGAVRLELSVDLDWSKVEITAEVN